MSFISPTDFFKPGLWRWGVGGSERQVDEWVVEEDGKKSLVRPLLACFSFLSLYDLSFMELGRRRTDYTWTVRRRPVAVELIGSDWPGDNGNHHR